VATAVERIVSETFAFEEIQNTCIVALRKGVTPTNHSLYKKCLGLLDRVAEASEAKVERITMARRIITTTSVLEAFELDRIVACAYATGQNPAAANSNLNKIISTVQAADQNAAISSSTYTMLSSFISATEFRSYLEDESSTLISRLGTAATLVCPG